MKTSRAAGEPGLAAPDAAQLRERLAGFLAGHPEAAAEVVASFRGGKLRLTLPPSPRKGLRPQDVVAEAFGLADPSFLIRREAVVLRPARTGPVNSGGPRIDRSGGIR